MDIVNIIIQAECIKRGWNNYHVRDNQLLVEKDATETISVGKDSFALIYCVRVKTEIDTATIDLTDYDHANVYANLITVDGFVHTVWNTVFIPEYSTKIGCYQSDKITLVNNDVTAHNMKYIVGTVKYLVITKS